MSIRKLTEQENQAAMAAWVAYLVADGWDDAATWQEDDLRTSAIGICEWAEGHDSWDGITDLMALWAD